MRKMAMTDLSSRFGPLTEELLENRYARENLREGAEKLREAYARAQKRRVKPSRDRKLRAQVEAALAALDEGSAALLSGRRKPKRTGRNALLGLAALGAAGAGVALAVNEELRDSLLGSARTLGEEITSEDGAGS
jgi:hypothetical protein